MRAADVLVIGAGQAGLSAAHHLVRRGFKHPDKAAAGERTFLMLDAEDGPGGAWRHRWDSLTMATVNGIHDLPGMPQEEADPSSTASATLTDYFTRFEDAHELQIERPVDVTSVRFADASDPNSELIAAVSTPEGEERIRFRVLVNATGTWRQPFVPFVPGIETFAGQYVRTVDYRVAEDFAGKRVGIVGGGISAIGFLLEVAEVAETHWFTRREPEFREGGHNRETLTLAVEGVDARVREGLLPTSVVKATGLAWTPALLEAKRRGILERQPMFTRIEPNGVQLADGSLQELDVIIWATGFRQNLDHLAPLRLRGPGGGIRMDPPMVADEPRIYLIGYGPSASTIGANRAGRAAVRSIVKYLDSI